MATRPRGSAGEETELDQVGLVDIHDGVGVLGDGRGERVETDGTAVESLDQGAQQVAVVFVESQFVNAEAVQGLVRDLPGDCAVGADFGVVAHAAQQAVGDPRRAAGALGQRARAGRLEFDLERGGGSDDDLFELVGAVEIKALDHAEAVAQRRRDHRVARRRADQREGLDRELDAARGGSAADHHEELEILHRRIKHFFGRARHAVNLVDEEHVVRLHRREDGGYVTGALDRRAAGWSKVDAELAGDDAGERSLAQSRRTVKQQVVERLVASAGGVDRDANRLMDGGLADEVFEP